MKIAVVVPPVEDFYLTPHRCSYLGAKTVIEILKKGGHQTAFFGLPTAAKSKKQPLPVELDYLKDFLLEETGPLSWFTARKRFGNHYTTAAEKILSWKPEGIFLSCFAWCYADESLKLAEALRKLSLRSIPLFIGGSGVSTNPQYFIDSGLFEYVLPGEAEKILPSVMDLPQTLPEITPLWSLALEKRNLYHISVLISRGCPKKCSFCSNFISQGRKFRSLDQKTITTLLSSLPVNKPISLNFEDDNLLFQKDLFFSILSELKNRYPDIMFTAENGLDYTLLTPSDLKYLIQIGFRQFNFSAGNYHRGLLGKEHRESRLELLSRLSKQATEAGIPVILYFISGLEGDSPQNTIYNLENALFNRGQCGISLFYPVPGLPGFTDRQRFEKAGPPLLTCGSSAYPWTGSLSTAQMITAFRLARLINLVKTQKINSSLNEMVQLILKTKKLHTFTSEGKKIPVPHMDQTIVEPVLESIERFFISR